MTNIVEFIKKINKIEKRMEQVLENWRADSITSTQEIRFVCLAHLYNLYKKNKIKELARKYLEREVKRRDRLDSEILLTSIACALVINENFSEYLEKIRKLIEKKDGEERYHLIKHFSLILIPKFFEKLEDNDKSFVHNILESLENYDVEGKLLSLWVKKRLFLGIRLYHQYLNLNDKSNILRNI